MPQILPQQPQHDIRVCPHRTTIRLRPRIPRPPESPIPLQRIQILHESRFDYFSALLPHRSAMIACCQELCIAG
jgi:hypothetical protein